MLKKSHEKDDHITKAVAISKGEMKPSRTFTYEVPTPESIKAIREKTGLTQEAFAEKLQISPRTLQNWEQGHRNPTGPAVTLIKLLDKQPNLLDVI